MKNGHIGVEELRQLEGLLTALVNDAEIYNGLSLVERAHVQGARELAQSLWMKRAIRQSEAP